MTGRGLRWWGRYEGPTRRYERLAYWSQALEGGAALRRRAWAQETAAECFESNHGYGASPLERRIGLRLSPSWEEA